MEVAMTTKEERLDTICGAFMTVLVAALAVYWLAVWVPERDRFLWNTHDCYVNLGCSELTDKESIDECWSQCADEVRGTKESQWSVVD